jgi:hypothetical protein
MIHPAVIVKLDSELASGEKQARSETRSKARSLQRRKAARDLHLSLSIDASQERRIYQQGSSTLPGPPKESMIHLSFQDKLVTASAGGGKQARSSSFTLPRPSVTSPSGGKQARSSSFTPPRPSITSPSADKEPPTGLPITSCPTRKNPATLGLEGIKAMNSRSIAPAHKYLWIGILSNLAPLWLPGAQRLGQVVWIAGSPCTGFTVHEHTSIHAEVTPDRIGALLTDSPVDMVFYEGWGPTPGNAIWKSSRVKMLVWLQSRKKFRPSMQGWKQQHWNMLHNELGGASNASSLVLLASREGLEDCTRTCTRATGLHIWSPLGSATKDTLPGVPCKPPGMNEYLSGLSLVRIQDLGEWFKLRSVFSKTGWVRRTLKYDEILTVWEVSGDLIRELHSNQRRVLVIRSRYWERHKARW